MSAAEASPGLGLELTLGAALAGRLLLPSLLQGDALPNRAACAVGRPSLGWGAEGEATRSPKAANLVFLGRRHGGGTQARYAMLTRRSAGLRFWTGGVRGP